jgi:phosphatidylserine decarboxylase
VPRTIPVAREGWPFIVVPGVIAGLLALGGRRRLALPFAAASLASLGFFRDPERVTPVAPHGVIAPADGRVTIVDEQEDSFVGPALRVSVFLSPLDVHVTRSPIAGLVVGTVYTSGRFLPAYRPEAGEENERCAVHIEGANARVTVVQIAGVAARRVVCRVGAGDRLEAGERFGIIRFGSRTDCFMPRGAQALVQPGDRVVGGETVIGMLE